MGSYYSQHLTSITREKFFAFCFASVIDIPFVALVLYLLLDGHLHWVGQRVRPATAKCGA